MKPVLKLVWDADAPKNAPHDLLVHFLTISQGKSLREIRVCVCVCVCCLCCALFVRACVRTFLQIKAHAHILVFVPCMYLYQ
jgi:hypothetical protein